MNQKGYSKKSVFFVGLIVVGILLCNWLFIYLSRR